MLSNIRSFFSSAVAKDPKVTAEAVIQSLKDVMPQLRRGKKQKALLNEPSEEGSLGGPSSSNSPASLSEPVARVPVPGEQRKELRTSAKEYVYGYMGKFIMSVFS